MTEPRPTKRPARRRAVRGARRGLLLAALSLAVTPGCGREFFRRWADQDVAEATFEKSRDPRWRLPTLSVEPPALSRYADYSDPEHPPAPPDDYAASVLSPKPQRPGFQLLSPMEGTGYLDDLERGPRYTPPPQANSDAPVYGGAEPGTGSSDAMPNVVRPPASLPPPPTDGLRPFPAEPGPPGANSGPAGGALTPNSGTESPPRPDPGPAPAADPAPTPPQAQARRQDSGVQTAAFQAPTPAPPQTVAPGATQPMQQPGQPSAFLPGAPPGASQPFAPGAPAGVPTLGAPPLGSGSEDPTRVPRPGLPPDPNRLPSGPGPDPVQAPLVPGTGPGREIRNVPGGTAGAGTGDPRTAPDVENSGTINALPPAIRPPGIDEATQRRLRAASAQFLVLPPIVLNLEEETALPPGTRPYVVGPTQALQLALVNSRLYQFRLESVYLAALPVTLQRFTFTPQFYAGLSPLTGVASLGGGAGGAGGGIAADGINTNNQFTYRTNEAPGGQLSSLNIGTVAGVGKLFSFGGRLVAGFANQTVINFTGNNAPITTSQSSLPLTFVVPFLRGGGRAVTLEPLTQAERNLLYEVRNYARFRQEFMPSVLASQVATTAPSVAAGGIAANDQTVGYLQVLLQLQIIENNRRTLAAFIRLEQIFKEFAAGASSGISELQVDQIRSQLAGQRQTLVGNQITYRNQLDLYKMQLGLPPDVPIVLDRTITQPFTAVFEDIQRWSQAADHDPAQLPDILNRLPRLDSILVEGRPLFDTSGPERLKSVYSNPDRLEEILLAGERVALENRLDLMNARATLYDRWRQYAVNANALQGVFNVALTNQIFTPTNTTNPFAFSDQAKNFQIVLNTELPLVRINERNAYRLGMIQYQQQRRALMQQEDTIKNQVRQGLRFLIQFAEQYEIARLNLEISLRQRDNTLQGIVAPPTAADVNASASGGAGSIAQVQQLLQSVSGINGTQNQLVQFWVSFQSQRMQLYRDLGIMPYDEWEAYYEFFPANPGSGTPAAGPGRPPGGAAGGPGGGNAAGAVGAAAPARP